MKKTTLAVLAVAFVARSAAAQDAAPALAPQPPPPEAAMAPPPPFQAGQPAVVQGEVPSNGLGYFITGAVLMGVGAANLATSPICKTDVILPQTQDLCLGVSIGVGATLLAVGIPIFAIGVSKRSTYREWKAAHPVAAGFTLAPSTTGGAVGWSARF